jgi:hypothetical protein
VTDDLDRHRFDSVWRWILLFPRGLLPKQAKVYCPLAKLFSRIPGPHTLERLCNVP